MKQKMIDEQRWAGVWGEVMVVNSAFARVLICLLLER